MSLEERNNKTHLCDSCTMDYPSCCGKNFIYGNGKGSDNIIACAGYEVPKQLVNAEEQKESVTQYWFDNYVEKNHCSLCGNSGKIDTTGVATYAGLIVGRVNFCICPNGMTHRRASSEINKL